MTDKKLTVSPLEAHPAFADLDERVDEFFEAHKDNMKIHYIKNNGKPYHCCEFNGTKVNIQTKETEFEPIAKEVIRMMLKQITLDDLMGGPGFQWLL